MLRRIKGIKRTKQVRAQIKNIKEKEKKALEC